MAQQDAKNGGFVGFVLLSEPQWSKEQLLQDLRADWDLTVEDTDAGGGQDANILLTEVDGMQLAVSFFPVPVPHGEAARVAAANYLWPQAVPIAQAHTAQLLVAVLGGQAGPLARGRLFVQAAASCLKQRCAAALYADGAVFEPAFYRRFARFIRDGALPVMNWVWYGIYRDETQAGIYTYGLHKFGKDELEVYVSPDGADLNELRRFVVNVVHYLLEEDVTLRDGETIGFSETQRLPIVRSPGIALDGDTIKIQYQQKEGPHEPGK